MSRSRWMSALRSVLFVAAGGAVPVSTAVASPLTAVPLPGVGHIESQVVSADGGQLLVIARRAGDQRAAAASKVGSGVVTWLTKPGESAGDVALDATGTVAAMFVGTRSVQRWLLATSDGARRSIVTLPKGMSQPSSVLSATGTLYVNAYKAPNGRSVSDRTPTLLYRADVGDTALHVVPGREGFLPVGSGWAATHVLSECRIVKGRAVMGMMDLQTGRTTERRSTRRFSQVRGCQVSADGTTLGAVAQRGNTAPFLLVLVDGRLLTMRLAFPPKRGQPSGVTVTACSVDGRRLYLSDSEGQPARVVTVPGLRLRALRLPGLEHGFGDGLQGEQSPDGRFMAASPVGPGEVVRLTDLRTFRQRTVRLGARNYAIGEWWTPDSSHLLVFGGYGHVVHGVRSDGTHPVLLDPRGLVDWSELTGSLSVGGSSAFVLSADGDASLQVPLAGLGESELTMAR